MNNEYSEDFTDGVAGCFSPTVKLVEPYNDIMTAKNVDESPKIATYGVTTPKISESKIRE